jgi:hypothetical protein
LQLVDVVIVIATIHISWLSGQVSRLKFHFLVNIFVNLNSNCQNPVSVQIICSFSIYLTRLTRFSSHNCSTWEHGLYYIFLFQRDKSHITNVARQYSLKTRRRIQSSFRRNAMKFATVISATLVICISEVLGK